MERSYRYDHGDEYEQLLLKDDFEPSEFHSVTQFARCGCNNACSCTVSNGSCTTVTGNGTSVTPYLVNVKVDGTSITCGPNGLTAAGPATLDTATVDLSPTGVSPLTADVKFVADNTNELVGTTNLAKAGTTGIYVSCEDVQDCVGNAVQAAAGDCLTYDDINNTLVVQIAPDQASGATNGNGVECTATGLLAAPSTDPGNTMIFGADGRLFTPASAVTLGCGLEFGGTGQIEANVQAWDFACAQDANATKIYCSPTTGDLQGPPKLKANSASTGLCMTPSPAFGGQLVTAVLNLVNNSCYDMQFLVAPRFTADIAAPGLVQYNVEVNHNGAGFVLHENGFWPGGEFTGQYIRTNMSQSPSAYNIIVPAGTTLTEQARLSFNEAFANPGNNVNGACLGLVASGVAI